MTSMLDVVFILLIFTMVAMSFQKEVSSLPVNLPKADTKKEGTGVRKEIFILPTGELRYQNRNLSDNEWKHILSEGEFKNTTVWIFGDEKTDYGKFVRILDDLKISGLKELHIAVHNP
ncbi:biopolymer transporter ExbD [Leptospira gomenensis]|uniref:Biopolymer transporter ExbD n=1 Tax=Leptospira gomenensis TaxID=2484974 RepID=A0A5F1YQQ4_9LEPT|nr:biopolymer transporter ExbD [Leptospira gomenensis]TGK33889.1 biopolymer transporter ExbD [Leptospira gomenensis]TGK36339.1 biopolymer transporter ExbD [Leptospira gomenensis]TGK52252.1 biopolymer transporter ExbD [Leptospira gomenensis]TGK59927.1 biopolymer transporter ExbD [Leptospira gomenensis]